MAKTRRILTNWSKGELTPLFEGRPDLAAYFEGAKTLENWLVLRQGGVTRWPGSRFVAEVKDSTKDTILWPFEFSVDDSYILEVGDLYIRVYRDTSQVLSGGVPVEIVTPFAVADIRSIHFTQSADILFTFHGSYQQRKLSRLSDTNWTLSLMTLDPPPSFEADVPGTTFLSPSANTGTGVTFRSFDDAFLAGDVGRQIIAGASRATITALTDAKTVTADIIDDFTASITAGPNTLTSVGTAVASTAHGLAVNDVIRLTSGAQAGQMRSVTVVGDPDNVTIDAAFSVDQTNETWNKTVPLAASAWAFRLSPQTTLDPTKGAPVGAQVTLTAGAAAFRAADVGKFVAIYGGMVRIDIFTSSTVVKGEIVSQMDSDAGADPPAAAAGTWTLEESSWSAARGWPRTGDFFQGRLYQASTDSQPVDFWGSRSDDFENYAIGLTADSAVNYTMNVRQVNRIEWLADNRALFIGTSGSEHRATGAGSENATIGGDVIPLVERLTTYGGAPIQPVVTNKQSIFVDRSRLKLFAITFDTAINDFEPKELTLGAEHITGPGVALGPLAFQRRPDPRLYFVRDDGELVSMTFFPEEKVVAFTRRTTQGAFRSVAVVADPSGGPDRVWVIVERVVNGVTKRFVEFFEDAHESFQDRPWFSLQTDSAVVYQGAATTTVAVPHLEGHTVDIVADGGYRGTKVVTSGSVTLDEAATEIEVGLHYNSTIVSMRPAVEGQVIEGLPRSWDALFVRVWNTLGLTVNGARLLYPAAPLDTTVLHTRDVKVTAQGIDTEGRITILQDQPYPATILCAFGTLSIGDHD